MQFRVDESASAVLPEIPLQGSMILRGDAIHILSRLPRASVQCVVTSPPYWGLRDYDIEGQLGLEETLPQFLNRLVAVFREVHRVLKDSGTLWLNIGDGYTSGNRGWRAPDKKNPARAMSVRPDTPDGLKPKDLMGIPWRLAFALQDDGWYLRTDIVWNKPNAMPESVKDRPTRSHEFVFMFTKNEKYYYDLEAVREPREDGKGFRNRRSVWHVNTEAFKEAHFATFPSALIEPCVLASTKPDDYVLDPFFGSGTVGVVCNRLKRNYVGIELHPEYVALSARRLAAANGSKNGHRPRRARSSS
jgi:site-specific DNA-methyltransferase (adenine-specific)